MNFQPSETHGRQTIYTCNPGGGTIVLPGYKDEPVIFTCYSCATKIGPRGLAWNTVVDCSGTQKKHLALVHTKDGRLNKSCVASEHDKLWISDRLERDHQWYDSYVSTQGPEGVSGKFSTLAQADPSNPGSSCFQWESSTEVPPTNQASALRIEALGYRSKPTPQAQVFDYSARDAANPSHYPPVLNAQHEEISNFPDPLTDDRGRPLLYDLESAPSNEEYHGDPWEHERSSIKPSRSDGPSHTLHDKHDPESDLLRAYATQKSYREQQWWT